MPTLVTHADPAGDGGLVHVDVQRSTTTQTVFAKVSGANAVPIPAHPLGWLIMPAAVTLTLLDGRAIAAEVVGRSVGEMPGGALGRTCLANFTLAYAERYGHRWPTWLRACAEAYEAR